MGLLDSEGRPPVERIKPTRISSISWREYLELSTATCYRRCAQGIGAPGRAISTTTPAANKPLRVTWCSLTTCAGVINRLREIIKLIKASTRMARARAAHLSSRRARLISFAAARRPGERALRDRPTQSHFMALKLSSYHKQLFDTGRLALDTHGSVTHARRLVSGSRVVGGGLNVV